MLVVLAWLLARRRGATPLEGQGWRLRRVVAGRWAYEEKFGAEWMGIPFEELQDFREPPYVVVAPSEDIWRTFPAWSQGRRAEIIGRVQFALSRRNYVVEVPPGAHDPAGAPQA